MIMVVTSKEEFRTKICSFLEGKGYMLCIPPHRQDMLPLVKEKNPLVIVLDMYVSEPNGLKVCRELRAQNYKGKVIVLAGTSVSSLISEVWHFGVEQVIGGVQGNGESINLDQVESAIKMALRSYIAKRAFELYEAGGHPHGKDLDDWLEAERQILKSKSLTEEPQSPDPLKEAPEESTVLTPKTEENRLSPKKRRTTK
ncbi:MAG: DUF2934 domain-containing protein [Nitrospirales bacterium]